MGGAITGPNGQPLGSPDDVKLRLDEAFGAVRFVLVRDEGAAKPSGLAKILFLFLRPKEYPYWHGSFEGQEFATTFEFTAKPIVPKIAVTLYGRGTPNATRYFTELQERTGWRTKFW